MNYIKFALNKADEYSRMVTMEGFSCKMAENSPSAYIIEKKILRKINDKLTRKDFDIPKGLLRFANTHWFEQKLNRIKKADELEKLYDVLMEDGLGKLINELR